MAAEEKLIPLRSLYDGFLNEHPKLAKNLTFNDYINHIRDRAEKKPELILGVRNNDLMKNIQEECEYLIVQLPEEAQARLKKIYDLTMPAIAEGFALELFLAILDQAKQPEIKVNKRPEASIN